MKNSGTQGKGGRSFSLDALFSGMRELFVISASAPENTKRDPNVDIREAYGDLAYGVYLSTQEPPALIVGMWDGFRKAKDVPTNIEMFDVREHSLTGRQFIQYLREEAPKLSTERRLAIIADNSVVWSESKDRFVPLPYPSPART